MPEGYEDDLSWKLYDLFGRVVLQSEGEIAPEQFRIDLSDLPSGHYVVEVRDAQGHANQRLVVQILVLFSIVPASF